MAKMVDNADLVSWCSLAPMRGCRGAGSLHTRSDIAILAAQFVSSPGRSPRGPHVPHTPAGEELLEFLQTLGQNRELWPVLPPTRTSAGLKVNPPMEVLLWDAKFFIANKVWACIMCQGAP